MVHATLHVAAIDDALLAEKKLMDNKLNEAAINNTSEVAQLREWMKVDLPGSVRPRRETTLRPTTCLLVKLEAKTTVARRRLTRSGSMVSCALLVFETVASDAASGPITFGTAPRPRSLS